MAPQLALGNLVSWDNGGQVAVGVVRSIDGAKASIAFDSGDVHQFAADTDVLSRVLFASGQAVRLIASDEVGVVTMSGEQNGFRYYSVTLGNGQTKTVTEDGLRASGQTDPIARLRKGDLDSARSTNLRVAATRLHFAHQFDELSSLSNSRVEIKPHQVGVLHRVATSYPHRFILADEVGLGKTIEAGLIIKELKARGLANRVLVLAPSGIVSQWQYELKTKFNQVFAHYKRNSIDWLQSEKPSENVWALHDNVIASASFAAWDETRRYEIALAGWDLVVIDEAHHARRQWQGGSRYTETNLYRLAAMLADPDQGRAQSFLLLTATPMQLHRFELYSLIELLDPALFPTFDDFEMHASALSGLNATAEAVRRWPALNADERAHTMTEIDTWLGASAPSSATLENADGRLGAVEALRGKHRLSDVLIRNRKKVVGGFMPRVAARWEVELTEVEKAAYTAVSEYVQTGYARSRATQNNALGFLMAVFQKLNTSSSYALRQSLLRRIEKLEAGPPPTKKALDVDEADLEEQPVEDVLSDWLGATERTSLDREEITELAGIVSLLDSIEIDSKTRVLLERLDDVVAEELTANRHPKVIIFTQFRATQEYLSQHLREPWEIHLFHGGLNPDEKDAAVARFRDGLGPHALISTEAGGEGRNFQFCHILINYDLPWNPMKVEQRIGRVDRIGQKHPVTIINFSTLGTIEERIVNVLTERIGIFEETIGGLDPILGEVEKDLGKIFQLAEAEADRAFKELEQQVAARIDEAHRTEERLADLIMDSRSFRKDEVENLLERHHATSNVDLRRFVVSALAEIHVRIQEDPKEPGIYDLHVGDQFLATFPQFAREEIKQPVTFDPRLALEHEEIDFLAFGHQLVDALVIRACSLEYPGRASHRIVVTDEVEARTGWLFVYALELGGLLPSKELQPVFVDADGTEDPELAEWLLARSALGKKEEFGGADPLPPRDGAFENAVEIAEQRAFEALLRRQSELALVNEQRLDQERAKLERFYVYRSTAERDKLAAVERIVERLSASDDPKVLKIVPVWAKNLDQARRALERTAVERERRLHELSGRDHVSVQHSRVAAFFVEVTPTLTLAGRSEDPAASARVIDRIRKRAQPTNPAELAEALVELKDHAAKLGALAYKHPFDSVTAIAIANALVRVAELKPDMTDVERSMLRAAIDYFVLVDDDSHDLTDGDGFEDDRLVANAVLGALGQPGLCVRR